MLEATIKLKLRAYLTKIGAYQFWPVQTGIGATTVDCLFCYRGKFYAVECKRPGVDVPTPRQGLVMENIRRAGGEAILENDPGLPNVLAMLSFK